MTQSLTKTYKHSTPTTVFIFLWQIEIARIVCRDVVPNSANDSLLKFGYIILE